MEKYTTENFIAKARSIHGDKYDYSKVEYINSRTNVCIICPIHGEFWQNPRTHLDNSGCPKCGHYNIKHPKRLTQEQFADRSNKMHNNKYDYSKSCFHSIREKVIIICPEHGEFLQTPKNHMNGQGCPKCGELKAKKREGDYLNARKNIESFKDDIYNLYGGKYEVVGDYVNNKTKIAIRCKEKYKDGSEHGIFYSRPDCLIQKHGCPKCSVNKSYAERELNDFIKSHYNGDIIESYRGFDGQKEIDIFLPDINVGFEYNGLLWHSSKYKENNAMLDKLEKSESENIRLINIFEDEWNEKKDICKSRILNILGKSERIYARKCEIKEIGYNETKEFLNKNHIQGMVPSKYNISLWYNNEIVSIMTFGALRKNLGYAKRENTFELLRFCNKINTNVIGGASKLFKYFVKTYNPQEIISYADRRWSQGNLYVKLGFNFISNTKPNYSYIDGKKQVRINRYNLRKNILVEKYGCPQNVTEIEFCRSKGFYQVFDCGNKKYIWKKEK